MKILLQYLFNVENFITIYLGKTICFLAMSGKLKAKWKLLGGFYIMDVGYTNYMMRFDMIEDVVVCGDLLDDVEQLSVA